MKNMKKRNILYFIIFILLVLACFCFILKNNNRNKIAKVEILNNDNISLKIDNSTPISDDLGIKLKDGNLEFSIKSSDMNVNSTKYEIFIKQINSVNSINADYIKLYLNEKDSDRPFTKKPEIFTNLNISNSDVNSRNLYIGTIKKNEKIKFRLRMWLTDNYTANNEKKNFEIILGVKVID